MQKLEDRLYSDETRLTYYAEEKLCKYPNDPCFECQILTKLMKKYLKPEVYNSLIN